MAAPPLERPKDRVFADLLWILAVAAMLWLMASRA